jgi:hypothetical protein
MPGWRFRHRAALPAVALLAVGAAASFGACRQDGAPERIVLVVIDTLRRDRLGAYGADVPTPQLDAFAAEGTRFERANGAFHQTTMSMGALFTGRTPSIEARGGGGPLPWTGHTWCGLSRYASGDSDSCIPTSLPTLAEGLRDAGYHTAGVVSNLMLFRPAGFDRGFADWVEVGPAAERVRMAQAGASIRYDPRRTAGDQVNQAVRDWLAARPTDGFFLYVHYMDVHDWFMHKEPYDAMVQAVDGHVGELREMLDEAGLLEGATLVITADHGERLTEQYVPKPLPTHMGNPSYQPVLAVPLIVWPRIEADPRRFMRSDDTFRLIRQLAGLEPGEPPDLLDDELLLSEQLFRTYRRGRWKSLWARGRDHAYLFDLESEEGELRDVSARHGLEVEAHRRRVEALSGRLAGESGVAAPSPEDLERLRALGYAE